MTQKSAAPEFRSGWRGLTAATVGSAVGVTSLLFYSQGSLTLALQKEFGWNRADISSAYLFTTLALTLATLPLGWLLDRFGPRAVALVSAPGLTVVLALLSQFNGPILQFYGLYALAGLLGAGTTSVVYTKVVSARFFRRRGLALGITLSGIGAGALALPPLVTSLVQASGWRSGFLALTVLSLVVVPFIVWGLKRPAAVSSQPAEALGMSRKAALTSRPFWTIVAGFIFVGVAVPAVIPHMVPMLADAGVNPAAAASIASLIGVGVIIGRLSIGFFVDRFFAPFVAAPLFLITALGCLLLAWGGAGIAPAAALMIGVSFGAEADLIAFLCANYFGLKNYGFIYGAVYAVFGIAISVGPILAGRVFDATGSYSFALIGVAVLLVLGCATLLTLPRYGEKPPSDATGDGDGSRDETENLATAPN